MLRLTSVVLIEGVGNVERRPRDVSVYAKRIERRGMEVEAIEERYAISVVVQRLKFRWIEKAVRPESTE